MSGASSSGRGRQLAEVVLASVCLVALGLLAVALVGSGGTLAEEANDTVAPTEQVLNSDRPGLIGGGSLGSAERNPLGAGVENETNPFESRSDDRLFTAVTDRPTYWRVDSYDEYTNGTWVRTNPYEDYEPPIAPTGPAGEQATATVTTEREAAVLPTPWQPATVTGINDTELVVSAETGVHTVESLPTESEYTIRTYQYDPDPRALLVSRATYPETIEDQYAVPPEDPDGRIVELSDNITTGAVTPVQAVGMIEEWIAANKAYDPAATHTTDEEPLEQYLFEMEAGNAEYAASSVVVLARAQGIPARYVTGYTPGERTDTSDDRYTVRQVNAHAWAEVYVTGHGWVPFDPTPADERLAIEQQAATAGGEMMAGSLPADDTPDIDLDSLFDDELSADREIDTGQDGAETDRETADTNETTASDELPSAPEGTNVTIRTEPDPLIADGEATVTLTVDGEPVSGATVSIGDEQLGSTDQNGRLAVTVPANIDSGVNALIVQTDDFEEGQVIEIVEFELRAEPQRMIGMPGETVTVTATAGETPISDLEVRDEDGVVGVTDENGQITVPVSLAPEATIEATYLGATTTTQIQNRLLGIVLRGLGIGAVLTIIGVVLNREYNLRAVVRNRTTQGWQWTIRLLRRAIGTIKQLPTLLVAARRRGLRGSLAVLARLPTIVSQRLQRRLPDSVLAYLVALLIQLYRAVRQLLGRTYQSLSAGSESSNATPDQPTASSGTQQEQESTTSTVRAVWQTFVRLVLRRLSPTQTPQEIATTAIAKGFPRGPVMRLTTAFQRAAYGPTRSANLAEEATDALETIERGTTTEQDTDHPTAPDEAQ